MCTEKSPIDSYKSSAAASDGGSEPSILSREDLDQPSPPSPIKNTSLIVEDNSSTTKKLPSLTNEGTLGREPHQSSQSNWSVVANKIGSVIYLVIIGGDIVFHGAVTVHRELLNLEPSWKCL